MTKSKEIICRILTKSKEKGQTYRCREPFHGKAFSFI